MTKIQSWKEFVGEEEPETGELVFTHYWVFIDGKWVSSVPDCQPRNYDNVIRFSDNLYIAWNNGEEIPSLYTGKIRPKEER